MKGMEKNKGAAQPTRSSDARTLKDLDITYDESSQWQRLAAHKKLTPFFTR